MAFEAIARRPAFPAAPAVFACAQGRQRYPWEVGAAPAAPPAWRASRLRPLLEACLSRSAAARPTAAALLAKLAHLSA